MRSRNSHESQSEAHLPNFSQQTGPFYSVPNFHDNNQIFQMENRMTFHKPKESSSYHGQDLVIGSDSQRNEMEANQQRSLYKQSDKVDYISMGMIGSQNQQSSGKHGLGRKSSDKRSMGIYNQNENQQVSSGIIEPDNYQLGQYFESQK